MHISWCHVEAANALPRFTSGVWDGVTLRLGLILGKGPAFVYPPSWTPTDAAGGPQSKIAGHPDAATCSVASSLATRRGVMLLHGLTRGHADMICRVAKDKASLQIATSDRQGPDPQPLANQDHWAQRDNGGEPWGRLWTRCRPMALFVA